MAQDYTSLAHLLSTWRDITPANTQRHFLESHPELLNPGCPPLLEDQIERAKRAADQQKMYALLETLTLLRDIHTRGNTSTSIHDAYVNRYGGFALDLPHWLADVITRDIDLRQQSPSEQAALERVICWQDTLDRARQEGLAPEIVAELLAQIQHALSDTEGLEKPAAIDEGIACLKTALATYTSERYPYQWAMIHTELGRALRDRVHGERAQNLEEAITTFQATLLVYSRDAYPTEWARIQNLLGTALWDRIHGERAQNLEDALAAYHASLEVNTREAFPIAWAAIQNGLGNAYSERIRGERAQNLEDAILAFRASLEIFTREAFPIRWAKAQNNLALTLNDRLRGDKAQNLEDAIVAYENGLEIFTRDTFPYDWAMTHIGLGLTLAKRLRGDKAQNLEGAIAAYENSLIYLTADLSPHYWAMTQYNLGEAYQQRIRGDLAENLEKAIAAYQAALTIHDRDTDPFRWAMMQSNLGAAYRMRIRGDKAENLKLSLGCFRGALEVYTREAFPHRHREIGSQLAEVLAEVQRWEEAATAYASALEAEDDLFALSGGVQDQDALLADGRDIALRLGYIQTQQGDLGEAALAIERGRARGLAVARALNAADPNRISNLARRTDYVQKRESLRAAQAALQEPRPEGMNDHTWRVHESALHAAYRTARAAFAAAVTAIQTARDPADFLYDPLEVNRILQATSGGGPGHALIYLTATPWGGVALAARKVLSDLGDPGHFVSCNLPGLTVAMLSELSTIHVKESSELVLGGFAEALEGKALVLLQPWPGATWQERAEALAAASAKAGGPSCLVTAAQHVFADPTLQRLVTSPLEILHPQEQAKLDSTLLQRFLQLEVDRCLQSFAEVVIRPLARWVAEQGITSMTLIPCGALAAFPVTAAPLEDGRPLSEALSISVAPSARALLRDESSNHQRRGVYALGDPYPSKLSLPWSEVEARFVAALASQQGFPAAARVKQVATLDWLIERLEQGQVVDIACHGRFNTQDVLRSHLPLAQRQMLTLADFLNRKADLRGLRLLILSGCQTALLDLRGARDEVHSLAVGAMQAGAQAVLATLWSVDDISACLLVARFVQEWFPHLQTEPPALALARAQQWLRTVTNQELEAWRLSELQEVIEAEREVAGAQPIRPLLLKIGVSARRGLRRVRGGVTRMELAAGSKALRRRIGMGHPEARPFAEPYYWAGFQVTGW